MRKDGELRRLTIGIGRQAGDADKLTAIRALDLGDYSVWPYCSIAVARRK